MNFDNNIFDQTLNPELFHSNSNQKFKLNIINKQLNVEVYTFCNASFPCNRKIPSLSYAQKSNFVTQNFDH